VARAACRRVTERGRKEGVADRGRGRNLSARLDYDQNPERPSLTSFLALTARPSHAAVRTRSSQQSRRSGEPWVGFPS
jgi:hypothetical protein